MPQAVNPPVMYYKGTPYGLGGVTMVDKHSVMTMLYSRETGDSEDVITLSEDFDHFDLLVISGRAYITDGLWHQSNTYICDSLSVGNRVSIGDDGSISWFDIYDKTTLSRALDSGNPYQITHVMGVKFNGTTVGGGGGSTIELVDIFNGASDITPTYTNGVTVTTSSVTSNVGAMSCSEWSNGYEGFNIALSNLTVGEVYTLNFDFQFTNADYFAYNAYRTGFQLFAVDNRNYELYNTWPANLHRDNGLHNHKKKFTATASTMYLSFNLCGCSDDRTNYFEITNLYVQTTNASEDIGYSTDEQDTGLTWIDGSPVYQKTYQYNSVVSVNGYVTLDTSIKQSDIVFLERVQLSIRIDPGIATNLYSDTVSGVNVEVATNDTGLYLKNKTPYDIYGFTLTVRYAKPSS